jgi:hypothetical protein
MDGPQTKPEPMTLVFDSPSNFIHPAGETLARAQIYVTLNRERAVILIFEEDLNRDRMSVTNAAEAIAEQLQTERLNLLLPPFAQTVWVEVQHNNLHPIPNFDQILFSADRKNVQWKPMWRSQVETLIGQPLLRVRDGDEKLIRFPELEPAANWLEEIWNL